MRIHVNLAKLCYPLLPAFSAKHSNVSFEPATSTHRASASLRNIFIVAPPQLDANTLIFARVNPTTTNSRSGKLTLAAHLHGSDSLTHSQLLHPSTTTTPTPTRTTFIL